MTGAIVWPEKTREMHNHHMDSTIWNDLHFRDDDIVIATYAKAGTTWMQQMIAQMLFGPDPDLEVAELSPWMDLRVPPKQEKLPIVEAQNHRRVLKTHLPLDALVFSPKAKYLYIGRDGRDILWSLYNHHYNATQAWYEAINYTPGRVGPPIESPPEDIHRYWREWFEGDGYPFWSFWESVRSWWEARNLPNIMLVHYDDLKRDMPKEMRRIAAFLDIPIDERQWREILEYCSFEWMKRNGDKNVPVADTFWEGGARTFINKGTNGRWKDTLTAKENAGYERRAIEELGPECAQWMMTGEKQPQ